MNSPSIFCEIGESAVPQVCLLDARVHGLDDHGLRAWARSVTHRSGASHASRSYRYPYALVGWHCEPLGVDIERISPCDRAFADLICTPAERPAAAGATDQDEYLTSLWCSKEALAKTLGDAVLYEPSRLESPAIWPNRSAGSLRAVRLSVANDHVAWVCWRTREGLTASTSTALELSGLTQLRSA